jgi:hypothetical protein
MYPRPATESAIELGFVDHLVAIAGNNLGTGGVRAKMK